MIGYCAGLGHRAELRYRWTFPIGNEVALCVECCAAWSLNAARDRSLRPAEIAEIRLVCSWCPDWLRPDPAHHPDGQPRHTEQLSVVA